MHNLDQKVSIINSLKIKNKMRKILFVLIVISISLVASCNNKQKPDIGYHRPNSVDVEWNLHVINGRQMWSDKKPFINNKFDKFKLRQTDIKEFEKLVQDILPTVSRYPSNKYFHQFTGYEVSGKEYLLVYFCKYYLTINGCTPNPGAVLMRNKDEDQSNGVMLFDYDSKALIYADFK